MPEFRKGMFATEKDIEYMDCPILAISRNEQSRKCDGDKCPMIREDYMVVNSQKVDYVYCGVGGKP